MVRPQQNSRPGDGTIRMRKTDSSAEGSTWVAVMNMSMKGTTGGSSIPAMNQTQRLRYRARIKGEQPAQVRNVTLLGEPVRRREDARLIVGKGRYLDDIGTNATLAAAFVRSPHAHARIVDIDAEGALDVEGLVAIYTYDDLEADTSSRVAEPLPLLIPHPALTHGRTQYALAKDEVNYVGEAIAFVVAVDRYVAEDAVARIREVLPRDAATFAAVACAAGGTALAQKQDWPTKPVRFIVPYPPGGAVDASMWYAW